jgi:hypothetical protein
MLNSFNLRVSLSIHINNTKSCHLVWSQFYSSSIHLNVILPFLLSHYSGHFLRRFPTNYLYAFLFTLTLATYTIYYSILYSTFITILSNKHNPHGSSEYRVINWLLNLALSYHKTRWLNGDYSEINAVIFASCIINRDKIFFFPLLS